MEDQVYFSEEGETFLHSFGNPVKAGFTNIIRGISVIDDMVFASDQINGKISVYDAHTGKLLFLLGKLTSLIPEDEGARNFSDILFYTLEDQQLFEPYVICKAKDEDEFYVTEPGTSRLVHIRIPNIYKSIPEAQANTDNPIELKVILIRDIGQRRNQPIPEQPFSQFNVISAVIGLDEKVSHYSSKPESEIPSYLRMNPFQKSWEAFSDFYNQQYSFLYDVWMKPFASSNLHQANDQLYNIDLANWQIKSYDETKANFEVTAKFMNGSYFVGDLAIAAFQPSQVFLGQICPKTPLFFLSNFALGIIHILQFDLQGKLVNYGFPFGSKGEAAFQLSGPQGLAVNDFGEIYIADSILNRISKWQILPTGQVFFIKNFRPDQEFFKPTDVTIDKQNRVFVCDQLSNQIAVFDREGNHLWSYGQTGYSMDLEKEYANFQLPTSAFVDDDHLIVNDLVNRALKVFEIKENTLEYLTGGLLFEDEPGKGGAWMPYFIYAKNRKIYAPDSAYNIVSVYEY